MTNLRKTFGLACPHCGNDQALDIEITCLARVTADGSDPIGDHEWNDSSTCWCPRCSYLGDVGAFSVSGGQP